MRIHVDSEEAAKWISMAVFHLRRVAGQAKRAGAKHLNRVVYIDADTKIRIDFRNSLAQSVAYITAGGTPALWYFYIVHNHSFWNYPNGGISSVVSTSVGTGLYDEDSGDIERGNGAVLDTWIFTFTSPTEFDVAGAATGAVGSGDTSSDFEPDNPSESGYYFYLGDGGWTGVWAVGDTFRFHTTPRDWVSESLYYPTDDTGNTFGYSKPGKLSALEKTSYADARNLSQYVDAQLGLAVPSLWLGGYTRYNSVDDSFLGYKTVTNLFTPNVIQMASSGDNFTIVRRVLIDDLLPDDTLPTPTLVGQEVDVTYPPDPAHTLYWIQALAQGSEVEADTTSSYSIQLPYSNSGDGGWTVAYMAFSDTIQKGFQEIIDVAPDGTVTKYYFQDATGSEPVWSSDVHFLNGFEFSLSVNYTLGATYVMFRGVVGFTYDFDFLLVRAARIYVNGVFEKEIPSIYVPYEHNPDNGFLNDFGLPAVATSPDGTQVVYAIHDRIFRIDKPYVFDDPDVGQRLAAYPAWPPEFRILVNDVESTFDVKTDIDTTIIRRSRLSESWNSWTGFASQIAVNDSGQYVIASVSLGAGFDGGDGNAFRNRFSIFNGTLVEDDDPQPFGAPLSMTNDNGRGMGAAMTPNGVSITLHRNWIYTGTETTFTFRVADGSTFLWEQDVINNTAEQIAAYPHDKITPFTIIKRVDLFEISDNTVPNESSQQVRTRVFKIIIVFSSFLFNEWTMNIVLVDNVFDEDLSDIFDPKGFLHNSDISPGRPANLSQSINLETSYALIVP